MVETDIANEDRPWQIGLDVKTDAKGDRAGRGRGLREAITQVETGVNGGNSEALEGRRERVEPSAELIPAHAFLLPRKGTKGANPLGFRSFRVARDVTASQAYVQCGGSSQFLHTN